MTSKQILSSRIAIGMLIVLLAFLANSKYKQWQQANSIDKLRNDLIKQADVQEKKNQELTNSISFLNSGDFKEQVARQQLNLKKDGEVVYNFTQGDEASASISTDGGQAAAGNAQKWWKYFFQ